MGRPAQVGVVGRFQPVPPQPGDPDVVGVHRDDAHAADEKQRGHRDADPQHAGEQRERGAQRQHDDQVPQRQPAPPPGVDELVPHPFPVALRQPDADREQRLSSRAWIPGEPGHRRSVLE
jgi:hypothetical protein